MEPQLCQASILSLSYIPSPLVFTNHLFGLVYNTKNKKFFILYSHILSIQHFNEDFLPYAARFLGQDQDLLSPYSNSLPAS